MNTILNAQIRSIKPKEIIEKFKKSGIDLSESDAERYLDLLYFLAGLVVNKICSLVMNVIKMNQTLRDHIIIKNKRLSNIAKINNKKTHY